MGVAKNLLSTRVCRRLKKTNATPKTAALNRENPSMPGKIKSIILYSLPCNHGQFLHTDQFKLIRNSPVFNDLNGLRQRHFKNRILICEAEEDLRFYFILGKPAGRHGKNPAKQWRRYFPFQGHSAWLPDIFFVFSFNNAGMPAGRGSHSYEVSCGFFKAMETDSSAPSDKTENQNKNHAETQTENNGRRTSQNGSVSLPWVMASMARN